MPTPRKNPTAAAPAPASPPVARSETKGSGTGNKAVKAAATVAAITPTHDDIARRAYEIYAGRGHTPGDQGADWAEAERQLKAGM